MSPSLKLTITLGQRETPTTIHLQAEDISPNDVRQWLERAIIALGAEREALANCGFHGELTLDGFEERCVADEVELAAALSEMQLTARGWRKRALAAAYYSVARDQSARRIIREAAKHIKDREG